jgi:WD40 repeat protein
MSVLSGHVGPVSCGSFVSDGKLVITGGADGTCRLWSPRNSMCIHNFQGDNATADTDTLITAKEFLL